MPMAIGETLNCCANEAKNRGNCAGPLERAQGSERMGRPLDSCSEAPTYRISQIRIRDCPVNRAAEHLAENSMKEISRHQEFGRKRVRLKFNIIAVSARGAQLAIAEINLARMQNEVPELICEGESLRRAAEFSRELYPHQVPVEHAGYLVFGEDSRDALDRQV